MPSTRRKSRRGAPSAWRTVLGVVLLVAASAAFVAPDAAAHDLGFTRAVVALLPDDYYRIDLVVDLDALALGAPQDTDNAELLAALNGLSPDELETVVGRLRETFSRRVRVRIDGEPVLPDVLFPDAGTERARANETVIGLIARLEGRFPEGSREFTLQASRAFPPLHITFVDVRGQAMTRERVDELLEIDLGVEADAGSTNLGDRLGDLVTSRQILELGDRSTPYPLDAPPPRQTRGQVVIEYLVLGFEHIVPLGIDHILFVLGLYLLNTAWRPLLAQVTAFTVAHTITLGLSTYGVISLPGSIVEPLIALSIAYVAFENVTTDELHWWRPAVVFAFGLLHGLGFAGVLAELGLPRDEYLAALLSFNVGVELGQLAVIAVAFLLLGAFREREWYRHRVTIPLSILIGVVGLYWAVERVFFA